jgi:hypothetical protein
MNPRALGHEILTVKEILRATATPPGYGLQAGQGGQNSCLQDWVGLAIPKGGDSALDG